jgi:hypothetical protein
MDTIMRGHRGRRVLRLLPVILAALVLGVIYVMMSNAETPRRGAQRTAQAPASASRPINDTRAADIYYQNQLNYDQAYEACKELGVGILATSLGVRKTPGAVAAAYARDELPAFRKSLRDGCLQALLNKPPAHRTPADAEAAAP